jgi:hypothetical protein
MTERHLFHPKVHIQERHSSVLPEYRLPSVNGRMINEYGAHGTAGNETSRENQNTRNKPTPVPIPA